MSLVFVWLDHSLLCVRCGFGISLSASGAYVASLLRIGWPALLLSGDLSAWDCIVDGLVEFRQNGGVTSSV